MPRLLTDFPQCGVETQSTTVGPVRGHSIERIGDGEDARAERYLHSAQAAGIAAAIILLVVIENQAGCRLEKRALAHHFIADANMRLHDAGFLLVQVARLK